MKAPDELLGLAEDTLRRALALGADAAEAYVVEDTELRAAIFQGLTHGKQYSRVGLSVRFARGRRVGLSSAWVATPRDAERVVRRAAIVADAAPEDPHFPGFPKGAKAQAPLFGSTALPLTAAEAFAEARAMAAAVAEEPSANFSTVAFGHFRSRIAVANSAGTLAADAAERSYAAAEVRSLRGSERSCTAYRELGEPVAAVGWAREHAREVAGLHSAVRFGKATVDLLLDPYVSSLYLPYFSMALSADMVAMGASPWGGKEGAPILSEGVGVRDAADVAGKGRFYDDEGVPSEPLALVERGVLKTFLRNSYEAARAGEAPRGKGIRGGARIMYPPSSNATNLELAAGRRSLEEMIRETERGVLVKRDLPGFILSYGASGTFSFVAPCAYLVEKGEIAGPLPPATLGGNYFESLADPRFEAGDRIERGPGGMAPAARLPRVAVSV